MAIQAEIDEYTGIEVIELSDAKDYLRVDHADDNAFITELIKIARMQVFNDTNTAVVETEITEYFEKWPSDGILTLRYFGKISTLNILYFNSNNEQSYLTQNTDYKYINYKGMPKVEFVNSPTLYDRQDAVKIHYHIWPNNDDSIRTLKMAMYLLIGHFYDNRSAVTYGNPKELPIGYQRIINQNKNYMWI